MIEMTNQISPKLLQSEEWNVKRVLAEEKMLRASGFEWVVYTYIYMPAVHLEQNETRLLDKSDGHLEGFGVEAYLCDPADSAHCFVPGYGWMSDVYLHQQKAWHSTAPISSTLSLSHTHSLSTAWRAMC